MSITINDHVQNTLPRSSVYDFKTGSDLFISQTFAEIYPDTNASSYSYAGDKKITFMLSSPQQNQFCDLRSHYIKFNLTSLDTNGGVVGGIAEPMANIIDQLVIRAGDTVVEDIRHFNNLTSAFQRTLLARDQKKANWQAGWDLVDSPVATVGAADHSANCVIAEGGGKTGKQYVIKLSLSGIMNNEVLQSMYYMPLMIDIYLADPRKCGLRYSASAYGLASYQVLNPRMCITILETNPLYVQSFVSAMGGSDGTKGIRFPFDTWYNYYRDIDGDIAYWIKIPKRFVRGLYSAPAIKARETNGSLDAFGYKSGEGNNNKGIVEVEYSVGTQRFRKLSMPNLAQWDNVINEGAEFYEFFLHAAGVIDSYHGFSNDITRNNYTKKYFLTGVNLDKDPDNSVSSTSTLNGNDVMVQVKTVGGTGGGANDAGLRLYNFIHYLASLNIEPNNQFTLLDR